MAADIRIGIRVDEGPVPRERRARDLCPQRRDQATATVKRLKGELGAMGGAAGAATGPLGKLSSVTGGLISPVGLAVGGTLALGAALVGTVQGASDQAEALSKLRVVYGDQAAGLEDLADRSTGDQRPAARSSRHRL